MAKKTKTKTTQSKTKTSNIFLCCFGSHRPNNKDSISKKGCDSCESDSITKKKRRSSITSWFSSWQRIGMKKNTKSTSKTVPLEPSFSNVKKALYSNKSRSKSLSTLLHHKSQAKKTKPPPTQPPPAVLPGTPYYSPTQTLHGHGVSSSNNAEDTREQARGTPTRVKRQERRLSSTILNKTTFKKPQNARGSYDPIVGMSVLLVTLIIMVFWGRLCAVLCTSAWLYFIPRFRKITPINDIGDTKTKSNDVDLDSEEYKRKVIMEGLLGRNHRGRSIL